MDGGHLARFDAKAFIKDLNDIRVMDKREVYRILKKGSEKRRTAETKMNAHSSRFVVWAGFAFSILIS